MNRDDESQYPLPPIPFLTETIDSVYRRLERIHQHAATDCAKELIDFAKRCADDRLKAAEPVSVDTEDKPAVASDAVESSTSESDVDETLPKAEIDYQHTVTIYDPDEAKKQLDDFLPTTENLLERYLQSMVEPEAARRKLAFVAPGMVDACRALIDEFPNLASIAEIITGAVALSERQELPIRLPRLHIDGPPGVGKTELLRRIADILKLPLVVFSMSTILGEFELPGAHRTWRGSEPGLLIKSLLASPVANPIFLFDDAELGDPKLYGPLLSFLEDAQFTDHFLEMAFCTSHINKLFITNDGSRLSPAIRSRLYYMSVMQPSSQQMHKIIQRLYANLRRANPLLQSFADTLQPDVASSLINMPMRGARTRLEAAMYRAACRQQNNPHPDLTLDDVSDQFHSIEREPLSARKNVH